MDTFLHITIAYVSLMVIYLLVLLCLCLGIVSGLRKYRRFRESMITSDEEIMARESMHNLDDPVDEADDVLEQMTDHTEESPHRRVRVRAPFVVATVVEIKNEMGCPTLTPANRLVVRKKAYDIMKGRGLRPVHIGQIIEQIVALVFVPTATEISYRRLYSSREWTIRRRLFETTVSPPTFWSWLLVGDERYWGEG
jgi:hypothetical protein